MRERVSPEASESSQATTRRGVDKLARNTTRTGASAERFLSRSAKAHGSMSRSGQAHGAMSRSGQAHGSAVENAQLNARVAAARYAHWSEWVEAKRASQVAGYDAKRPASCDQSPDSIRILKMSSALLSQFPVTCLNASGCRYWGKDSNLSCCYVQGDLRHPPNASMCEDAMWYHVPDWSQGHATVYKPRKDVVLVAASLESSANYPLLDSWRFMSLFDIEQTYRVTSPMLPAHLGVIFGMYYWVRLEHFREKEGIAHPPIPTAEKLKAIVAVISNCGPKNHRMELVKALMGRFEVHSYGYCLKNRNDTIPAHLPATNVPLYSKYRFCVAMENSNRLDYVSEKVYETLTAGCLPLYMGAPNIQQFLPYDASRMIVDRNAYATEELFFKEIQRLMDDDDAYEEYMAWRKDAWAGKPFHAAYQMYMNEYGKGRPRCQLCQYLATRKLRGLEV
eukprot:jgi/Mesvir1/10278/Mv07824-RA.2